MKTDLASAELLLDDPTGRRTFTTVGAPAASGGADAANYAIPQAQARVVPPPLLAAAPSDWTLAERIGFRFLLAYIALTFLPNPFDTFPGMKWLSDANEAVHYAAVPWLARHVLRIPYEITSRPNGSGDTTFNYVEIVCILGIAALVTLVWSLLDRRRSHYASLAAALRIYVRYLLASVLLIYGLEKVVPLQFGTLDASQLTRTIGGSTPMGLLWTFMAASRTYTFYGGLAECVPALLLLFRRTALLGALLGAAVLSNVVMLNFSYDVCVKLYSMHLLLLCILLIAPDARRLADFFLLHRPTAPNALRGPRRSPRIETLTRVAKVAAIVIAVGGPAWHVERAWQKYSPSAPRPALYGLYDVNSFTRNGAVVPPLLTEGTRWRSVFFDADETICFVNMKGERKWLNATDDAVQKTLTLTPFVGESGAPIVLSYTHDGDHVTLTGPFAGASVSARATRSTEKFPLVERGFHWINERPHE